MARGSIDDPIAYPDPQPRPTHSRVDPVTVEDLVDVDDDLPPPTGKVTYSNVGKKKRRLTPRS